MSSPEHQTVTVDIDQNPYLAAGSGTVDAIVTISVGIGAHPDPETTLRLWIPAGARAVVIRQVAPEFVDLTATAVESGTQLTDYHLAAWGAEDRDYHIEVEVEPAAVGREKLAARVSVLIGGEVRCEGKILAIWTDDTSLSARVNPRVAHYTGQSELAQAIHDGLAAREQGDLEVATTKLRRALALAEESGDRGTADLLRRVVDVDKQTGTIRLRPNVAPADRTALEARSTRTMRVRKES
jgi:von Willebrand factor type A C-terminal domain